MHWQKVILYYTAVIFALAACKDKESKETPALISHLAKGADISWVTEMESKGVLFSDNSGTPADLLTLLKSKGINSIRLRVWVNPTEGWNGLEDMLQKARRANAAGMQLMIDFHFSDTWADPGHQAKPLLWQGLSLELLKDSVYNHVTRVLQALKNESIVPVWIQMGNETNNGMLWPEGRASDNMAQYAELHNSAYTAAKAVFPNSLLLVHISNGYDNALSKWLLNGLLLEGAKIDAVALSLYPGSNNFREYTRLCLQNMRYITDTLHKPVLLAETGMPWDEPDSCYTYLQLMLKGVEQIPQQMGKGVFYWEPQAYNNWKGYSLGAFNNSGRPTHALEAFKP